MLLQNRVAIVTGSAKGMGRAISLKFAEEGAAVAAVDISIKEATEVADIINKKGGKAIAILCDVTNENQIKETVEKTLAKFGKIDILCNTAGGSSPAKILEEIQVETWDKI